MKNRINRTNRLLAVIPHSSVARPKEIKKSWLSEDEKIFLYSKTAETDRGTKELYDFTKILGNKQLVFPHSQIFINVCRKRQNLNESVPLDIRGERVYKKGKEPSLKIRKELIKKYYEPFINRIEKTKKSLILNGHSTIAGHGSLDNKKLGYHILLLNYFIVSGKKKVCAPLKIIKHYAIELKKRFPNLKIGLNKEYNHGYETIGVEFGTDQICEGRKVPVILQETDESLYMKGDKINYQKLNRLRKAFASSLLSTMEKFKLL